MPKMTPEQEATYALNYGASRADLSPAAQEAYDRLLQQRRRGEPDKPVPLADAEAAGRAAVRDAKRALAEGRRVYLCAVPMMFDRAFAVGTQGLAGPSSVIEAIENLGWRLDQMSWVPRAGMRAERFFLFAGTGRRRASNAPGTVRCAAADGTGRSVDHRVQQRAYVERGCRPE